MYTKTNAENYLKWVRGFFNGKTDSPGFKSDNKKYDAEPAEGINLKEGQAAKRNDNLAKAQATRIEIHKRKINPSTGKNRTPAEMGKVIFDQKLRGGNCAEMTWLCCYGFRTKGVNIWIAITQDPGDHQFCILAENKPTCTTIEKMTYSGEDQWIIDPWANIVCKPAEFAERFTNKMKKWTESGKRVGVAVSGAYIWTAGSDSKYLSSILTSSLIIRQGW